VDQNVTAGSSELDLSIPGDFTEGLGLTDGQIAAVKDLLEEYRGQGRQMGTLWNAAADLQDILSSEQVDAISARQAALGAERKHRRDGMREQMREDSGHGRFRGHEEGPGREGIHVEGLDLTDEQIAQMKQIRESFAPRLEAIRDAFRSGSLARDEARARSDEIREAMHDAVSEILTDEQLAVLEENKAEAGARREEMRIQWEGRRQADREQMVSVLGLTTDQLAAMDALRERSGDEGRPSAEDAEACREEHHQALLDILDDEQEEIWILHGSLSQWFASHRARNRTGAGFGGPQART